MIIKIGQTIHSQSGDVPFSGVVQTVMPERLFVHADRVVPIVLGKGSRFEKQTQGDKLWVSVPGGEVVRDKDGCLTGLQLN